MAAPCMFPAIPPIRWPAGNGVQWQRRGEFVLKATERVPVGTVVTEGVWWREFIPGRRGVNALTSQRLTDSGRGSTLYDVAVEVRGKTDSW